MVTYTLAGENEGEIISAYSAGFSEVVNKLQGTQGAVMASSVARLCELKFGHRAYAVAMGPQSLCS